MLVSITPTHALSKENFKIEYREGQRETTTHYKNRLLLVSSEGELSRVTFYLDNCSINVETLLLSTQISKSNTGQLTQ